MMTKKLWKGSAKCYKENMKLVCIVVLVMFFLSCCPKEADGKSFGAEVGIMTAKPDGLSCMFSISSNLPYDVGIYCTGHNVRLIEFPRIRSANGEVLRSYETGFPSWLDIAAKSSVSFQCDLPLSEKEQRLFEQGKIKFEYPVVSYSSAGSRRDAGGTIWIAFDVKQSQ